MALMGEHTMDKSNDYKRFDKPQMFARKSNRYLDKSSIVKAIDTKKHTN